MPNEITFRRLVLVIIVNIVLAYPDWGIAKKAVQVGSAKCFGAEKILEGLHGGRISAKIAASKFERVDMLALYVVHQADEGLEVCIGNAQKRQLSFGRV